MPWDRSTGDEVEQGGLSIAGQVAQLIDQFRVLIQNLLDFFQGGRITGVATGQSVEDGGGVGGRGGCHEQDAGCMTQHPKGLSVRQGPFSLHDA